MPSRKTVACVLALLWSASACGGMAVDVTPSFQSSVRPELNAWGDLPPCAPKADRPVDVPTSFPRDVPLPAGIRPYRTETIPLGTLLVGHAPYTIHASYQFLRTALPRAGYTIKFGESEANDVEIPFEGKGARGAYRVNSLPDCAAVTLWNVIVLD